jgi:beta-glucosidase
MQILNQKAPHLEGFFGFDKIGFYRPIRYNKLMKISFDPFAPSFKNPIIIVASIVGILVIGMVIWIFVYSPWKYRGLVEICDHSGNANCSISGVPYQDASLPIEDRVNDLLSRMTPAEKIGQLALVDKSKISQPEDIARYGIGALLSGGGSKPPENTPRAWLDMVNGFQDQAQTTRLRIPLLYGVDANHGHANVFGATVFPHAIGLGATDDPELVKKIAQITAQEVAATGISWIFGPSLDVVRDIRWGRTYEQFGSDSQLISKLGVAYIHGLQETTPSTHVAATAKHYMGNGATSWGTSINKDYSIDQGVSQISEQELRRVHLPPFKAAVDAEVKTVMVGLNGWQGQKVTGNKYLLTEVLKEELGFEGIVVSDWYGVYEIGPTNYRSTVTAINAGIDMVMLPFDYKIFTRDLQRALARGDVSQERLDDAVRRILRLKFELGLFEDPIKDNKGLRSINSEEHQAVARQAVRQSLVLLKNDNHPLPLSKDTPYILVAGSSAHNLGKQSGGWTIEWQGVDGNWFPGTTILDGIKNTLPPQTNLEFNESGDFTSSTATADVGIAVVGESPYAEGVGDNEHPSLSEQDLTTIEKLRQKSRHLVVIIVSGRPLDIRNQSNNNNWDTIIAAWLPGTQGQGVADVLFGDHPFTGKLPIAWPVTN